MERQSGPGLFFVVSLFLLTACAGFSKKAIDGEVSNIPISSRGNSASPFSSSSNIRSFGSESDAEDEDDDVADADAEPVEEAAVEDVDASETLRREEIEADALAERTFPLVDNEFVQQWVRYFTGRGRKHFQVYLERSARFAPLIFPVLKREGLPENLFYLAMIESGFSTRAYSRAHAVGPWQFIKGTGKRYGLKIGYWQDERRDFVKSTEAAARYLKELHTIFGSWYLAAAAYNAGEGKVFAAIKREKTRNFWELSRRKHRSERKNNFRAETRNYVPKIIAAALIARAPAKYGFTNIAFHTPWEWEDIELPSGVRLSQLAQLGEIDEEELKDLNPELRKAITPPLADGEKYVCRVPKGKREALLAKLDQIASEKIAEKNFEEHRVRAGDNLGAIARRYRASVSAIKELNNIRSDRSLRIGQRLQIPMDLSDREFKRLSAQQKTEAKAVARDLAGPAKENPKATVVATATTTTTTAPSSTTTPHQELLSKLPTPGTLPANHTVRRGDTLWDISRRYKVSVDKLQKLNNLSSSRSLREGMVLKLNDGPVATGG